MSAAINERPDPPILHCFHFHFPFWVGSAFDKPDRSPHALSFHGHPAYAARGNCFGPDSRYLNAPKGIAGPRLPWVMRSSTIAIKTMGDSCNQAMAHPEPDGVYEDFLSQAAAAHKSGDDNHGQHHDNGLVDAHHYRWEGQGYLDLEHGLKGRRAVGLGRFDHLGRYFLDTQAGHADHRRQRVQLRWL